MFVTISNAQEANNKVVLEKEKTAQCTPTAECAKKMGMTLAECKAKCKKACASKASTASTAVTAVASASDSREMTNLTGVAKKACCASIEECAKKAGMTVAECKAKCKKACAPASASTDNAETAVASSLMVNPEMTSEAKVKACSSKKACCKKKK